MDRVVLRQAVGQPKVKDLFPIGVGLSADPLPAAGGKRAEKYGAQHAGKELFDSHF